MLRFIFEEFTARNLKVGLQPQAMSCELPLIIAC